MADDRPAGDDLTAVVATLRRELDDLRTTALARMSRSPTGDVEPTIRQTPKPDTLLLQGQTVNRADYPGLWQWVQDQGLTLSGLFTTGNGSTTFGLPDMRGRVPVGAGSGYDLGERGGAASLTLSVAQMPSHNHGGDTGSDSHNHGGGTDSNAHSHSGQVGDGPAHGGHAPLTNGGTVATVASGVNFNVPTTSSSGYGGGGGHRHGISADAHSHGFSTDSDSHNHSISSQGSGSSVDTRMPYLAMNWLIWT